MRISESASLQVAVNLKSEINTVNKPEFVRSHNRWVKTFHFKMEIHVYIVG
jgi:hypothetical protein